ncbi:hypothetical protein, partial [Bacillus thuringiensis]|uniref:hypothetical protein n=1 Tax=Bacillus thuringiensis TaxID=1428 RepID=UPI001C92F66C
WGKSRERRGERVSVFEKVIEIKEKGGRGIVKDKGDGGGREKGKLGVVKKGGFWKVVIWGMMVVVGRSGMLGLVGGENGLGK